MGEEEERVSLKLIGRFKMPPERIKRLSDKKICYQIQKMFSLKEIY